ncbi:hypothetical protein R5R35_012817 [Gryllus longicercus]|uniref:CHCH domain-containing protein n=1 Tax=Gryllus longicercus TaxID=2509291 RepID=A0AAN9YT93_9ORTH
MSSCKQVGKDKIIFATKEDHEVPSSVQLPDAEPSPGLILSTGEINWNCPCLGGMATGPCGVQFRDAFSCFHYSEAEPKGSDCYDAFKTMQECMSKYPALYNKDNNDDDDDKDDPLEALANSSDSLNETEQKPIEHREAIASKGS